MKSLSETLGVPHTARPEESVADVDLSGYSAKDFAQAIIHSVEFRKMLMRMVTCDQMAPQVILRMFDYAYGKPVEKVEVKDTTRHDIDKLSPSELRDRAREILMETNGALSMPETIQ